MKKFFILFLFIVVLANYSNAISCGNTSSCSFPTSTGVVAPIINWSISVIPINPNTIDNIYLNYSCPTNYTFNYTVYKNNTYQFSKITNITNSTNLLVLNNTITKRYDNYTIVGFCKNVSRSSIKNISVFIDNSAPFLIYVSPNNMTVSNSTTMLYVVGFDWENDTIDYYYTVNGFQYNKSNSTSLNTTKLVSGVNNWSVTMSDRIANNTYNFTVTKSGMYPIINISSPTPSKHVGHTIDLNFTITGQVSYCAYDIENEENHQYDGWVVIPNCTEGFNHLTIYYPYNSQSISVLANNSYGNWMIETVNDVQVIVQTGGNGGGGSSIPPPANITSNFTKIQRDGLLSITGNSIFGGFLVSKNEPGGQLGFFCIDANSVLNGENCETTFSVAYFLMMMSLMSVIVVMIIYTRRFKKSGKKLKMAIRIKRKGVK